MKVEIFALVAARIFGTASAQFNYPIQSYLSGLGNVAARGLHLLNRGVGGFDTYNRRDVAVYRNRYYNNRYNNYYRGYNRGYGGSGYYGGYGNAFDGDTIINGNNNYDTDNNYYNDQSSNIFGEGGSSDGSESVGYYNEGDSYSELEANSEGKSDVDSSAGDDYSYSTGGDDGDDSDSGEEDGETMFHDFPDE